MFYYSVIRESDTADQFCSVGKSALAPAYVHDLTYFYDLTTLLLMWFMLLFSVVFYQNLLFAGCFPLRERPLYAISDGEIDPVEVGAPVFGTLADYAEFHIFSKSTKNGSTNFNRIDLAVRDGIKRALTKRETTCERTNFSRKTMENKSTNHMSSKMIRP